MSVNNSISEIIVAPFFSPFDNFLKGFSKFIPSLHANSTWNKINILLGLIVAFKIKKYLFSRFLTSLYSRIFVKHQPLIQKYGEDSWVLIGDIKNNQKYAIELGKQGFNLILLGTLQDLDVTTLLLNNNNVKSRIVKYIIDWKTCYKSEQSYEKIFKQFANFDISFLITPKIEIGEKKIFCKQSTIPITSHTFLLVNIFLKKLRDRSYRSAIIINSNEKSDEIEQGYALQYGAITSIDFFGRYLNYQVKHFCDVIVVRKAAVIQNVLMNIGKKIIINDK